MEREQPELSLKRQVALLSLSRASLYYQPVPPSAEEIAIKHQIDELYTAHPFYGSRKITALLQSDWTINRKRVQRYMREMGLAGICPGPNLSRRAAQHHIYPYLYQNAARLAVAGGHLGLAVGPATGSVGKWIKPCHFLLC